MPKTKETAMVATNPKNQNIVDQFVKLIEQIKMDIDATTDRKEAKTQSFRLRQVQNVVDIIKKYSDEIKSGEQLKDIKGVGKGTISRISEILQTGRLSEIKVKSTHKKYLSQIEELEEIIGIGRKTAYKLIKNENIKSVADLKKKYKAGKIDLPHEIVMGLKYHGVYKQGIPRAEIDKINIYLRKQVVKVDKGLNHIICGSYRREKTVSNDIDVLITHPKIKTESQIDKQVKNYLIQFIELLKKDGFLVDDLTDKDYEVKYMGFCQFKEQKQSYPIRRIDIRYVPFDSYYFALLYFTGSGEFNRKMRQLAQELGYRLNEYGLYKEEDGSILKLEVNSEKDIFEALGMEYIPPNRR